MGNGIVLLPFSNQSIAWFSSNEGGKERETTAHTVLIYLSYQVCSLEKKSGEGQQRIKIVRPNRQSNLRASSKNYSQYRNIPVVCLFVWLGCLGQPTATHPRTAPPSMDDVLYAADKYLLEPYLYSLIDSPLVKEPNLARNSFGLWFVMTFGGMFMYLFFAALSYAFIFDKQLEKNPLVRPLCCPFPAACWPESRFAQYGSLFWVGKITWDATQPKQSAR